MRFALMLLSACGEAWGDPCASGACEGVDASSLLQARSLLRKSAGVSQFAQLSDANALLQSMQNVARSLTKGSVASMAPDAVNDAVGAAGAAISTMMPLFEQQHTLAQHEISIQHGEIEACISSAEFGEAAMLRYEETLSRQHAAKTECDEALELARETATRACEALSTRASRLLSRGIPANGGCSDVSSPDLLYEVASSWAHWVHEEWEELESHRNACSEATTAATHRADLCAATTVAYEEGFCQHSSSCNDRAQCYAHKVEVYNALMVDEEAAMTARQEQYRVARQSECLMELIISAMQTSTPIDDDSLTSCDDVNVDGLIITFPEVPPAPAQCPASQSGDPECDSPTQ